MVDFVYENVQKNLLFFMQSAGKRFIEYRRATVCMFVTMKKKSQPIKKLYTLQKNGLMKNCAKMWSHGYGIYENVIIKVVAIRKKNVNGKSIELYSVLICMTHFHVGFILAQQQQK